MQGTDMGAIEAVRNATTRRLTAAGGITTMEEVNRLDALGVDAVVGMAIYTGRMSLSAPPRRRHEIGYLRPDAGPNRQVTLLLVVAAASACSRQPGPFSEPNARGPRRHAGRNHRQPPVGTPANARARAYIIDQLRLFGFEVRVQDADARRVSIGRTARVSNIIAIKPGRRSQAIGLCRTTTRCQPAPVPAMMRLASPCPSRRPVCWLLVPIATGR